MRSSLGEVLPIPVPGDLGEEGRVTSIGGCSKGYVLFWVLGIGLSQKDRPGVQGCVMFSCPAEQDPGVTRCVLVYIPPPRI